MRVRAGRVALWVHGRSVVVLSVVLAALLCLGLLAVGTGDYSLSPGAVLRTLAGDGTKAEYLIVVQQRLPRLVAGMLVGAALGVAGAVFQSLTRNPLGSPDVIGFTTGSATGGIATILLLGGGVLSVAVGAFCGGVLTAAALYLLCGGRGLGGNRMVLLGVGLSIVLTGVNSYLLTRATTEQAGRAATWLVGDLAGRGWEWVLPLLIALLGLGAGLATHAPALRVLESGEEVAAGLGVPVPQARLTLVLLAVGCTAAATATAGPVVFVALAAPQLARRLTRTVGPNLLAAAAVGALLVTASDYLGQRLLAASLLPVGVITGSLGGIYLAWLLLTSARESF